MLCFSSRWTLFRVEGICLQVGVLFFRVGRKFAEVIKCDQKVIFYVMCEQILTTVHMTKLKIKFSRKLEYQNARNRCNHQCN